MFVCCVGGGEGGAISLVEGGVDLFLLLCFLEEVGGGVDCSGGVGVEEVVLLDKLSIVSFKYVSLMALCCSFWDLGIVGDENEC